MKLTSKGSSTSALGSQATPGRREFLQTMIAGAGATAVMGASPFESAFAKGDTTCDALLLSCMDFRLIRHIAAHMATRGLTDDYDHVILAGASLGANNKVMPGWGQTFWNHFHLAIGLHRINRVIVMDHRSCGAYEKTFGKERYRRNETELHTSQLRTLRAAIRKNSKLEVHLLLMDLSGKVETIS